MRIGARITFISMHVFMYACVCAIYICLCVFYACMHSCMYRLLGSSLGHLPDNMLTTCAHRTMFGKYGSVARVVLSPSRTFAIVEMLIPQDARVAFRALAYRRFHNEPLYLEVS